MKVALIIEAAGAPHSLASTAFAGALMEGLTSIGVNAKVIGAALSEENWIPRSLGPFPSSAPWLSPPAPRVSDRISAARSGVLDDWFVGRNRVPSTTPDWYRELLLDRELRSFAADDPHGVVMVYPRSYTLLTMASRIAARLGWKVVVFATEALTDKQIDPATRDDYIRWVASCAAGVWAVSSHLARFWESSGVPEGRLMVWPGVVRKANFGEEASRPDSHSAVYIGNLVHREIDYLIDIAGSVREIVPDFRLSIFGDATDARRAEIVAQLEERGLSGAVKVEPPVPPAEVPSVLRHAEVLLLPRAQGEFSTAGFPNKLGEYLASGRPVVVTSVGDIPHYLKDGETALLVAPDDCVAFSEAVVGALRDGEHTRVIGVNGQRIAEQMLRADVVAERAVSFVQGLPDPEPWSPVRAGLALWWHRVVRLSPDAEHVKRGVVRVLRFLHLKPEAPESEIT